MRRLMASIILIAGSVSLWAGGQAEGAASATRGKYLAGKGIVIPPAEIHVDSYISQIDFNYPEPSTDLGVTLYSGHRQVSAKGQREILQIGIQGRKLQFQDLPPMNLAFVIDKSGSMQSQDKMGWVKEAFTIFIQRVRGMDFVSLVVFDSGARVVYPSTRMDSVQNRLAFRQEVENLTPGGGTNLVAGLELGYQQVLSNFRKEYTNRVLFLTDGVGESKGILDMADTYKQMGINVSAIGVGENFDANLMVELARKGGGSSRFISDRQEMEKTFGSELDRMLVPVANNLEMRLEFLPDVEILGTWGYDNAVEGKTLRYFLPTLHHRDYETILVDFRILPQVGIGEQELASFSLVYTDVEGSKQEVGPFSLKVLFVEGEHPVTGFSDAMVLQAGTMLHFAQALQAIGGLYYSCQEDLNKVNAMREALFRADTEKAQKAQEAGEKKTIVYEDLTSPEIRTLESSVSSKMTNAMELTSSTKKELVNTRMRLDNEGFDDEIGILNKYMEILGRELKLQETEKKRIVEDQEMAPPVKTRSLQDNLGNLFREMTLNLQIEKRGVLAVSGFTTVRKATEKSPALLSLLNETAVMELSRLDTFRLVERDRLVAVLEEQELALSDLMDTTTAIRIGNILSANYILTGSVIETSDSVIIFGRIINVETAEIQSVSQVIIQKDANVKALL